MKGWANLGGVVETIYEEADFEFSSSSSPLLLCPSSPPTPLHSRVQAWSLAAGIKTDILIRVSGKCFHLHKDPLTSRSTYLKRQLTSSITEFILSPPLNISAETFTLVADFCYGAHLVITPFNLSALRTAAELLEMTEPNGDGDDNLVNITDTYFRRVVALDREKTSIVFRSCMTLLPEAETAAFLVTRCVEILKVTDGDEGDEEFDWFDDVLTVCPEDFHIVAEALQHRYSNHDIVYKIVNLYIQGHNGKITEDHKTQICNTIDCKKLSPQLLIEAVQNPAMPLRFIVRAMLIEQLNTRRSFSTATTILKKSNQPHDQINLEEPITTLGTILQRDAAYRQASQLKASMDATTKRIHTLEEQLTVMKMILNQSSEKQATSILQSGRSASFHGTENKMIRKSDKISNLSASFRFFSSTNNEGKTVGEISSSCKGNTTTSTLKKKISQRVIKSLKKAFGVLPSKDEKWSMPIEAKSIEGS